MSGWKLILGTPDERRAHKAALVDWFNAHREQLDEDSLKRLETNPLRILDSKNPTMQPMLEQAPRLLDYLSKSPVTIFAALRTA